MVGFSEVRQTFVSDAGAIFSFKVENTNNYNSNTVVTVKQIDPKRACSVTFITSHATTPFVPSKSLDQASDEELTQYASLMSNIQKTCFLSVPANTTIIVSVVIESNDGIKAPVKVNVSIREI
ncbi:MAG TPA: hypothetical protein P5539_08920 [Mesotoga sp.]|nr:hypothetical protein [Mesotoga sp.]